MHIHCKFSGYFFCNVVCALIFFTFSIWMGPNFLCFMVLGVISKFLEAPPRHIYFYADDPPHISVVVYLE